MSELHSDPLVPYFDIYEDSVTSEEFLSSLPFEDRRVAHEAWRRVVEEPTQIDEFSDCLAALALIRRHGIATPPYSAVVDTYRDGYIQYTLQVGHVEDGLHFIELDLSDSKVLADYKELGRKLLGYLDDCQKLCQLHLTDISRVDQYLYGKNNSMDAPKPILVDLELHTGQGTILYQLEMFYKRFIKPLEESANTEMPELRSELHALLNTVSLTPESELDAEVCKNLKELLIGSNA
jgi:hypothetical protein